jgi:hypothetical protein
VQREHDVDVAFLRLTASASWRVRAYAGADRLTRDATDPSSPAPVGRGDVFQRLACFALFDELRDLFFAPALSDVPRKLLTARGTPYQLAERVDRNQQSAHDIGAFKNGS